MRIYYGWGIVAMTFVVMMLTIGIAMNSYGMFVLPASQDLKLSRANVNTGIILISIGNAVMSPFLGRMLDVYPIRRIMAVCSVMFGLSLVILGLSHDIWLSAFALAVPMALGIAGAGNLTCTTLVARWFEAQRGRAMAIGVMGMSMGTFLMPQLVAMLLRSIGWRQCLIVLGVGIAAIFLAMVPFVRERPGPDDVEPRPTAAQAKGGAAGAHLDDGEPLKVGQVLRMPIFWLFSLSVAISLGAMQATAISIVPLAQESGLSVEQSAVVLSVLGIMSVFSKVVLAVVGNRLDRVKVLVVLFFFIALTSAVLLVADSYLALLICSALTGLAVGAVTPIFYALLADHVGAASFGTATGVATFIMSFFGAVSVRYGGEVYDRTGSYDVMFVTFIVVSLVSAMLMLTSRRLSRSPAVSALT